MPKWVKITLVVVLVVFVGVVAAVVAAARWVKSRADGMAADARVMREEGEAYGRGRDAEACLTESLRRVRACSGIFCEAKVKIFMNRCLAVATVPPDLCAGVPAPTDFTRIGQWQTDQCARRGFTTDLRCVGIISEIPLYCSQKR